MDGTATAVAPKKKFLAAQAEAAATSASTSAEAPVTPRPHGAGSGSAAPSTPAAQSNGSEGAWTVKECAPAGINAADSEEIVKFQNAQLYAAHQVCGCNFCTLHFFMCTYIMPSMQKIRLVHAHAFVCVCICTCAYMYVYHTCMYMLFHIL